jgi:hypothetical protein
MARYKTLEQRVKDRERRDDIKEILNYIKYHADVMDLPPEIRELVRNRLQSSRQMQKSEQTILRERWNQYVDDQCHKILAKLAGTGYTPACEIVLNLPFEMTPQRFGQRLFEGFPGAEAYFIYNDHRYTVEREERRLTKLVSFEDRVLHIPCTRVVYRVTKRA